MTEDTPTPTPTPPRGSTQPTEPTTSPEADPARPRHRRRGFRRRWLLLSGIPIAAAGLFAARAFAHGGHGFGCGHGGGPRSADALAERMVDHLDFMLDRVDADDAQRAEVAKIAARQAPALFEQRTRARALRGEMVSALRQGEQDRLEALRKRGVTLFDEATATGLSTAQQVGDVLDDDQRAQVLAKLERFLGRHHH